MASTFKGTLPSLRIRFDEGAMRRAEADLQGIRNGMPRVITGAINKILPKVKTRVTKELASVVTAKPNNIRNRIGVTKATHQTLSGSVNILFRQVALINFKHKEKRKKRGKGAGKKGSGTGVTVWIYKDKPPYRLPRAFIAIGKSGNKQIFERKGKRRLPIFSRKGVSFMKEYEKRSDMQFRVREYINGETGKELDSQVNRLLSRKKNAANA